MRTDLLMALKTTGSIEKPFPVMMSNLNSLILMSFLSKFWTINMWFFQMLSTFTPTSNVNLQSRYIS